MTRLLASLLSALLLVSPAYAGTSTITTKDASGVTKTFDVVTDGSGNFGAVTALCDGSALASCLTITGGKALVTPDLPTGASTAALQTTGNTALTTINTTLGTPMQASGGTVTVTQGTGTNLHAVLDTTSTTAVTQATGTNLHSVIDSGTVTTVSTVTNLAQMNGAALLMGNGVTGTGSQRVTIASDNTAFSVNATVSQATSSNLKGQVDPLTAASWGIGTATQNSASATNGQLALAQFNTSPTTISAGNMSPLQMDNAGNLLVNIKAGSSSGTVAQGSTTSGQSGNLVQGAVTTSAPTYTTAQTNPLSLDTAGNLRVNVTTATGLAQEATTSGTTGSGIMGSITTANPSYTTAKMDYASLDVKGNLRAVLGGGVPETISATGTTGATTATLATGTLTTTYICGFSIRANATAAATGNATVTGTITGTLNFTQWTAPLASGLGVTEETFTPCIPASAANTTIAVVSAAPGTGGVVSVSAWGYQQ